MIVAGQRGRMDEVVTHLQMDVLRVGMHGAVALVLGQAQRRRETLFNAPQHFRGQPGLVFRPEADHKVVGFGRLHTGVQHLGVLHLGNALGVVIPAHTTGAPRHGGRLLVVGVFANAGKVARQPSVIVVFRLHRDVAADHTGLTAWRSGSAWPASSCPECATQGKCETCRRSGPRPA